MNFKMISKLKYLLLAGLVSLLASFSIREEKRDVHIKQVFSIAEKQYRGMLNVSRDLNLFPRTTAPDGALKSVSVKDWTVGFWPGSLWYMYEFSGNAFWREHAMKWTRSLEANQYNTEDHDIGFMMYCSYGNAYRLTRDSAYLTVLVQSAKSLISRYSPVVGSIKSWNERKSQNGKYFWKYPVIIDNMMNLELLFFASRHTGNPIYRDVAVKHAQTTMKNHLRPDYSCYHLVNYDEEDGRVLDRKTVQGFSDQSAWARGQAWGVYGFTVVYRETGDKRFLHTAQQMANYFLDHERLPKDKIPYWDFFAGEHGYNPEWDYNPDRYRPVPRDASAAAILSSALLELSTFSEEPLKSKYFSSAERILIELSGKNYLARPGTNNYFLLKNSVGHMPKHSEVNVPLIYADYYFLEGLLRYHKQRKV